MRLAAAVRRLRDRLRPAPRAGLEAPAGAEPPGELSPAQRQMIHAEKLASLGTLAGAAAHELNNPLSAILMYARLVERELGDGGFSPAQREELGRYLRQIQTDARRCGDIVHGLMLFAHPSGGEFATHHLNQIVERSLILVRHHLEIAHIRLETHLLHGDDAIACDADHLQQALVALFVRAVEAMPGGGTLAVRAAAAPGAVQIEIADTGEEIPPEVLPRVFEPFVSPRGEQAGAGFGLAAVDAIVRRHGGTIAVESAPGAGTTIRVCLPRHPPAAGAKT